jgi:isopentenyl diphosphate isomerase/L-lactate dehydrogenase-like FMN-dependent dehydrogenase
VPLYRCPESFEKGKTKERVSQIQKYWASKAKEKGILTEKDPQQYLNE